MAVPRSVIIFIKKNCLLADGVIRLQLQLVMRELLFAKFITTIIVAIIGAKEDYANAVRFHLVFA